MAPKWHKIGEIPFEEMWVDDKYWLPLALSGKKFQAEFYFNEQADGFDDYKIKEI